MKREKNASNQDGDISEIQFILNKINVSIKINFY